ncbi:MAG: RND transporter [Planctomycetaceae bacterium]|nr:MAG: RND transporter [Planctomycetaceae bacterium]
MMLKTVTLTATLILVAGLPGCTPQPGSEVSKASQADTATASSGGKSSASKPAHDHSGWWCNEHGMPEEVCAQCSSKVAKEFQKKGDWCQDHNRPDTQCFLCHPELESKFAAQYEAKYGKKPPKPQG